MDARLQVTLKESKADELIDKDLLLFSCEGELLAFEFMSTLPTIVVANPDPDFDADPILKSCKGYCGPLSTILFVHLLIEHPQRTLHSSIGLNDPLINKP